MSTSTSTTRPLSPAAQEVLAALTAGATLVFLPFALKWELDGKAIYRSVANELVAAGLLVAVGNTDDEVMCEYGLREAALTAAASTTVSAPVGPGHVPMPAMSGWGNGGSVKANARAGFPYGNAMDPDRVIEVPELTCACCGERMDVKAQMPLVPWGKGTFLATCWNLNCAQWSATLDMRDMSGTQASAMKQEVA